MSIAEPAFLPRKLGKAKGFEKEENDENITVVRHERPAQEDAKQS